MKRAALILDELNQISTISQLTGVFEGIASMEIAKVRDQTLRSKQYFADLWNIYSQLRLEKPKKKRSRQEQQVAKRGRNLFIAITSQGGLSGDIDSQVINALASDYDSATTDVIVIGGHGSTLLNQVRITAIQHLRMPVNAAAFTTVVDPVLAETPKYAHTVAYYQTYASLSKQHVARIELIAAVATLSEESGQVEEEVISPRDYHFEPNLTEIVDYLGSMMLGVVLSQVLLESKLSQAASRFNAMARAKQTAREMQTDLRLNYNRSRRATADERTREIITVLNRT